ncbi:MAG TPA: DoxX subfamily [Blastocatellia bacterium]|nr:DoxX subfamily [Blastocatellia bacterium]
MSNEARNRLTSWQQVTLILLRTLIGWHFLYEGYYKLALPGWSAGGMPLARWSSAGYLKAASGPLAWLFQRLIDAGWTSWIDNTVKAGLLLIGLSLMLGLFTKAGCWGAIFFLTLFYAVSIPLSGIQQPMAEGAYLIVNKTLIEAVAVLVLLAFRTGEIAGLDLLLANRKARLAEARSTAGDAEETRGMSA